MLIRRFHACLAQLPPELRTVLELRGGADAQAPLTRAALASYLHMSTRRVAKLEARALHRLGALAREHRCTEARAASTSLSILSGFEPPLGGAGQLLVAGPGGSVAADRSAASAPRQAAHDASSSRAGILPAILRPGEEVALVVLLVAGLAALLLAGVLFGEHLALALRGRHWGPGGPRRPRR